MRDVLMVRNCAPFSMETTLYEEPMYHRIGSEMNQMKRTHLTLDFQNPMRNQAKKMKYNPAVTGAPVLSSPDINMLKLGSPELEKLIMQNGLTTSTPTPTQILFPKTVTEEQEMYARGFVEALSVLHNSDSSQGLQLDVPVTTNGGTLTYMNLDHANNTNFNLPTSFMDNDIIIKDEPQTVPSLENTPPMSPIDMETQEKIKLERKRQRNRVAASKCRRRKLERISKLEDKVKQLKGENTELSSVVNKLKEHVCILKKQVLEHVDAGCQIVHLGQLYNGGV